MKREHIFWLLHIVVPLVVGGLMYLQLRPDTYLSGLVCRGMGISAPVFTGTAPAGQAVLTFLRNFLCDMLWAYALTMTVAWILERPAAVLIICCTMEMGIEWLQRLQILSGTFDPADIILECITTIIALFIVNRHRQRAERRSQ